MLLLPGGMCSARSYLELMQQPSLSGLRLVAATMPGQAGAPSPDDYSHEAYGRMTADLVAKTGAEVVVGFSLGANAALEMAEKNLFTGPMVLLGISLSLPDESAVFINVIRLSRALGSLPLALMKNAAESMVKGIPVPPERRAELAADFRRTSTRDMRLGLREYLKWLKSGEDHAAMLCRSGVPTWVVHAEKGDGGLTGAERRTLEACSTVKVVTVPGSVFFLPNEVPDQIASVVNDAVGALNA
ncbi:alpha/beta fold hydrolase [Promicromonospora sp. NPDC057138]|uniref:alpha/beta fold hydrolase n=1 Tax=Promicromonospora sp. NPDC057138 TaxID=3346031 RepID=UPI0036337F6B